MTHPALTALRQRADGTCAVATTSPASGPQAALAFFTVLDDGRLLLNTHTTSRKWANLLADPRLGLVAGWSFDQPHVQLDGRAEPIPPGHPAFARWMEIYLDAFPQAAATQDEHSSFVLLTPTWARVTRFRPDGPPSIEEGPIGAR
jgi:pyridoxine/pyridoxamine 5'-phosphate oxidase